MSHTFNREDGKEERNKSEGERADRVGCILDSDRSRARSMQFLTNRVLIIFFLFSPLQVKSRSSVSMKDAIDDLLIHQIERNIHTSIHLISRITVVLMVVINLTLIHHR